MCGLTRGMCGVNNKPRVLIIRRDNIGDLVCTTPLITAIRQHYPEARISALVNSYNREVLDNNTDVDAVYWYTKGKHADSLLGQLKALWARVGLLRQLRRERFDYVILATPMYVPRVVRMAALLGAGQIIGYLDGARDTRVTCPVMRHDEDRHEAEAVFRLLEPLGIKGDPPPVRVVADTSLADVLRQRIGLADTAPVYGIHISARKPSQRWEVKRYAELVQLLHGVNPQAQFVLFWAPGSQHNPLHPGDDEKAADLQQRLAGLPVHPCPTTRLAELIAGLSLCDRIVCSDGGAMHLAAGLGKPMVVLFGKSDAQHWHPWGVRHVVLQPPSLDVSDVSVEQVLAALDKL